MGVGSIAIHRSSRPRARLIEIEYEAFAQLIDKKLVADESFEIFITLRDEVMREL